MNEYLETFTKGSARVIVDSCGDARALDAWRQLADKGHSLRLAYANDLRREAFHPKQNVASKDIEVALSNWEADIDRYEQAMSETVPAQHRRMSLEDMCDPFFELI